MTDESLGDLQVLLRIPQKVELPLLRDATRRKIIELQSIILEILAAHYNVKIEHPKRGTQKKNTKQAGRPR